MALYVFYSYLPKPDSHRYLRSALLPERSAHRALFPFVKYLQVWLFKIKLLEKNFFSEVVFLLNTRFKKEMVLKIGFTVVHIDLTVKKTKEKNPIMPPEW